MQLLTTRPLVATGVIKDTRYYIDGKRVSGEKYNDVIKKATHRDSFITKQRVNRWYFYSQVRI